jgi:calcineurin-like phosphoesterase family protein
MSRLFVIGDTHFGHKNIIDYCDRPFDFVAKSMMLQEHGKTWLFQHYPIEPYSALEQILDNIDCDYLVHGHQHNHTALRPHKRSFNVSCENTDYTPILLSELTK